MESLVKLVEASNPALAQVFDGPALQQSAQKGEFDSLASGEAVLLSGGEALAEFETLLVAQKLPTQNDETVYDHVWAERQKLADKIKPRQIRRELGHILVSVLDDPFAEYQNFSQKNADKVRPWGREHMLGLATTSELTSSGRGVVGLTVSRVWIYQRQCIADSAFTVRGEYVRIVEPPKVSESYAKFLRGSQIEALKVINGATRYAVGGFN